jgi:hypothetical protein
MVTNFLGIRDPAHFLPPGSGSGMEKNLIWDPGSNIKNLVTYFEEISISYMVYIYLNSLIKIFSTLDRLIQDPGEKFRIRDKHHKELKKLA